MIQPEAIPQHLSKKFDYVAAMLEKTQGNRELAVILFNKLFTQLPTQLEMIEDALECQNIQLAQNLSHDLHGSVGFCGFILMQAQAELLEKKLLKHDLASIQIPVQSLKKQIYHLLAIKDEIIGKLNSL